MNNSQSNLWAGIAVLIFVGICVGLGITTHSAWVPVLTMVGFFVVYRGSAEGMSENIGRFVIFSLAGVILVVVAVVFGSTGKFPTSGWRWLWTPVWLFMCLAPFLASMELKSNNHDSASMLGTILGFLCLAVAIATPLLLPKLQLQDLPGFSKLNLPDLLWVVWLVLGLVSARLAYLHGDAMNPARFSLFALGAVAFLGWATFSSGLPGRWVWAIPWLIAVGLLYYGAKEVKLYRDWAGYLGYLLTLLSVAGAVLAVLWSYNLVQKPALFVQVPVSAPAATSIPTLAPTKTPAPAVVVQPTEVTSTGAAQQTRDIGFVWKFLVKAFTSVWGIFHLLILVLLGELWIKRWGEPLFLVALLAAAWYFGSVNPEAQAAWLSWISSSPVVWMRSILDYSIERFNTPGVGILLTGLALVILLFPASRILFQANKTLQAAGVMNKLLGTTAALRYINLKGVSQGRLGLAGILNVGLIFGTAISLWIALSEVAKAGVYPVSRLGFLFVPNLAVPSFKPVWQWQYFALAGIAWLAFVGVNLIQRRYNAVQSFAGCQHPVVSLAMLMVSAMLVPAGVMLLSVVQLVSQWLVVPLSFLTIKESSSKPSRQPVRKPTHQPADQSPPARQFVPPPQVIYEPEPVEEPEEVITPITISDTPDDDEEEMIGYEVVALYEPLVGMAVNDQGQCLALVKNGNLGLYEDGELVTKTKIDLAAPVGLACAARGELAVIGRNGKLLVLKLSETGFEVVRDGALSIPVRSYALNPFGTLLACCHPDMSKVNGVFLGKMEEKVFSDQIESPTALSFSPDGRYLAIGSEAGSVHIFDVATRQQTQVLEIADTDLEGAVRQVAGFKKDTQPCWLVTYEDEQVGLWDADGELIDQTTLSFAPECLAVDVARERFAVGGAEGQVEIYSAELLLENDGQAHDGKVFQLAFDKSSGQLFSAGSDNIIREIEI